MVVFFANTRLETVAQPALPPAGRMPAPEFSCQRGTACGPQHVPPPLHLKSAVKHVS